MKKPTVKNPELVEAIVNFRASETRENEKVMMEAIKNAKLIAPVIMDDFPEDMKLNEGEQYTTKAKFMMIQQNDGRKFFPAFTEWLELLKWKNDPECKTIVLTFEQYFGLLGNSAEAQGIVINPSEQGLMIPRQKMSEIAGRPLGMPGGVIPPAPIPEVDPSKALFGSDKQTNPELLTAINDFRMGPTPQKEQVMIAEIRKAKFVAPVQMEDLPEDFKLQQGETHQAQVKFVMVQKDGKKFFPLFTDQGELARWKSAPEHKTILLTFEQYCNMVAQEGSEAEGMVINPFGASLPIPKQQAMAMRNDAQLYDLTNVPMDMLGELKAHFAEEPKVHAAYVMGMRMNGHDSYMLFVDHDALTSKEEQKALYNPIADIVGKYTQGFPCGIVPANLPQSQQVIQGKTPFYQEEA